MAYERVNWENLPSTKTPVNADNLNKMNEGIKDLETELSKKANSNDVYTKTETDTKLNKKVNTSDLIDLIYPVGSIYMSANNVSPANLFGGKWEQIKDRFLLSAGHTYTAGSTGGEATHTLTINEMPSHRHQLTENGEGPGLFPNWGTKSGWGVPNQQLNGNGGIVNSALTGGGKAHNNLPPYLVVYIWKRTA